MDESLSPGYECVTGVDAVEERGSRRRNPTPKSATAMAGQAHPRGVPLSPPTLQRAHAGLGARLGRVREEEE